MQIDPIVSDFQYVRIRRSGGIMGVQQTVHVDDDFDAVVQDSFHGTRSGTLDAQAASELMSALARMRAAQPVASRARGCDLFQYDIELAAGGTVYHVSSVDLGADEALHGVMLAANRLLDGQLAPSNPMSLHTQAHVEPAFA